MFILFGIHRTSWKCTLISFTKFRKFSAIISSNIFPQFYFLFFPPGIPILQLLITCRSFDIFPQVRETLFIFFKLFSSCFLRLDNFSKCIFKFILPMPSFCYETQTSPFLISDTLYFSSKISFCFLFVFSVLLLRFLPFQTRVFLLTS